MHQNEIQSSGVTVFFIGTPLPMDEYYFHNNTVTNLASLGIISKEFRTLFDSGIDNAFCVFNDDGTYIVFNKTKNNLYCLSVYDGDEYDCCYITTVAGTEIEFSELDQRRAEAVRYLQKRIGFPSDNDLANDIDYNVIDNC